MISRLTSRQLAMLRYIRARGVTLERLRECNQTTLWSLLQRKLVYWNGTLLVETQAGDEALETYNATRLATRLRPANISERCVSLLHVARMRRRLERVA